MLEFFILRSLNISNILRRTVSPVKAVLSAKSYLPNNLKIEGTESRIFYMA